MLADGYARKIVCAAIDNEILILTPSAGTAYDLYQEIRCFINYTLGVDAAAFPYVVLTAAFNPIVVCSVEQWDNNELPYNPFKRAYRGDYGGEVLVTDKSIASGLRGIAEGVRIRYLPVEYDGRDRTADKIVESFQAKLDEIRKNIEEKRE